MSKIDSRMRCATGWTWNTHDTLERTGQSVEDLRRQSEHDTYAEQEHSRPDPLVVELAAAEAPEYEPSRGAHVANGLAGFTRWLPPGRRQKQEQSKHSIDRLA